MPKSIKILRDPNAGDQLEVKSIEDEELVEPGEPKIIIAFDPTKIRIVTYPFTVGQIMDRIANHEIQLNSDFQRFPNLWKDEQKSRLIESILLRLPLPIFYFDGDDDNNWQVVDGLQRIGALTSFLVNDMPLTGLQFLLQLEGKNYDELPREFQRRIQTFPVTINVIERGTPEQVKYHIFSRINEGGTTLTAQEIRHALHQGKGSGSELTEELVRGEDWMDPQGKLVKKTATAEGIAFVEATQGKIKKERMNDREYAARFVAFYLLGYEKYEPDLNSFLNQGMSQIKNLSYEDKQKLKDDFKHSMQLAYCVFGELAFRKQRFVNEAKNPINKALFEVISVEFARLNDKERELVKKGKKNFNSLLRLSLRKPGGLFFEALSSGTALKEKVFIRHIEFKKVVQKFLNG